MDPATALGTAVKQSIWGPIVLSALGIATLLLLACVTSAYAGDNYALVVSGASGGDPYAQKYDKWRTSFVETLREKFGYPDDHIYVLAEREGPSLARATRENVQRVLGDLRKRLGKDDQLVILLIGHGTAVEGPAGRGDDAKFNLVGPDLRASEWDELLKPIAAKMVFVDTTSASFPFLKRLAARGRIVLTATDSAAQQFETVFPEFFLKAFDDPAADLDKNGRVSLWEAFAFASAGVRQWFEQHGQLPTERPLLDDTGAGIGREAQSPGADGAFARATYLQPDAAAATSDVALAALVRRRTELESELEILKARKAELPPEQYDAELERVLLELARVSQQIRAKS
jgi:hypothetical protein